MTANRIKVLVIDDSAVMRELIRDCLAKTDDIEVVGTAPNGQTGLEKLKRLKPDVVTLDIQMPVMNGLETLDAALVSNPTPIIMVSALAQRSADITLDALERGAADYVAKPQNAQEAREVLGEVLPAKIRATAGTNVGKLLDFRHKRKQRVKAKHQSQQSRSGELHQAPEKYSHSCVAIGISTGGPPALAQMFEGLKPPLPPLVIVQHMPPVFTKQFAQRLDSISPLSVKEAATGDILQPNHVLVAPGGMHLHLHKCGTGVEARVAPGELVSGHMPSVDVMMQGAAELFGDHCLGVIMTGMGRDGADGCGAIRRAGGYVLGQDQATSAVYGMNKAAFVDGHVDQQFGLDDAAAVIMERCRKLFTKETLVRV